MLLFIAGLEWIIVLVISFLILLLPLIALINILRSEFTGNNKIIWVIIVLCLPFLGSVLYFAMGKNQKITN